MKWKWPGEGNISILPDDSTMKYIMSGYEVKKLTPEQYRQRIEDEGCPNCGMVTHRKVYGDAMVNKDWSEWRCSNADCPDSQQWTDIYQDLEDCPA